MYGVKGVYIVVKGNLLMASIEKDEEEQRGSPETSEIILKFRRRFSFSSS